MQRDPVLLGTQWSLGPTERTKVFQIDTGKRLRHLRTLIKEFLT